MHGHLNVKHKNNKLRKQLLWGHTGLWRRRDRRVKQIHICVTVLGVLNIYLRLQVLLLRGHMCILYYYCL